MSESEKLAREAWNVWDLDRLMANEPNEITAEKITTRVAAAIAAAEERGRRSGVEEAQRLVYAVMAEWPGSYDGLNCVLQRLKSLAPRDSGKEG